MEKISWNTVEYFHTEKNNDWYWIVGIVTISIVIISIILNNLIFALLILVSSFTLTIFASKRPDIVPVTLDKSGVTFGRNRFSYSKIISFWVETRDSYPRILLKTDRFLMPFIVIHTEDENTEEIREFLSQYLPEEENSEPLLEKVLLYLGF